MEAYDITGHWHQQIVQTRTCFWNHQSLIALGRPQMRFRIQNIEYHHKSLQDHIVLSMRNAHMTINITAVRAVKCNSVIYAMHMDMGNHAHIPLPATMYTPTLWKRRMI